MLMYENITTKPTSVQLMHAQKNSVGTKEINRRRGKRKEKG